MERRAIQAPYWMPTRTSAMASLIIHARSHSTSAQPRNKFVETALAYALTYISSHTASRIGPAHITILADSDYYSHTEESDSPRAHDGRFRNFNVPLHEAHKTGLGSSAALVTAFTAAVLAHYLPVEASAINTEIGAARIHNLAQAAHCTAQGKIGSGFDVAAAVYGSCVYRRFSPAVLEQLGDIGSTDFAKRVQRVVDDNSSPRLWDTQVRKSEVGVPPGLRLVMCDVDCGSETPGMVKKVFAWRKENPAEAALLWATLQQGTVDLASELQSLTVRKDRPGDLYENLRDIIMTIRSLVREMSQKAGVPIEPEVQTELLDACSEIPGVVGGVVPGAGGFDAIALLVEDHEETVDRLRRFLHDYKVKMTEDQGQTIGKVRLLAVKQEMVGIMTEDVNTYSGWL